MFQLKKWVFISVLLSLPLFAGGRTHASHHEVDAKKLEGVFTKAKCGMCHTWETYKLGKLKKNTPDPLGGDQFGKRSGPPDLSKLSPELMKEISKSKTFLGDYLHRKVKLRGKNHSFFFKGTPDDLKIITYALIHQKKK